MKATFSAEIAMNFHESISFDVSTFEELINHIEEYIEKFKKEWVVIATKHLPDFDWEKEFDKRDISLEMHLMRNSFLN